MYGLMTEEEFEQKRERYLDIRRRRAVFVVHADLIREFPELASKILDGYFIMRADMLFDKDCFEYHVCSEKLEACPEGSVSPMMLLHIEQDGEEVKHYFK